jgi:hypothetical protein
MSIASSPNKSAGDITGIGTTAIATGVGIATTGAGIAGTAITGAGIIGGEAVPESAVATLSH